MPEMFNVLVARDGEEFRFRDRDQDWIGMWHPPVLPAPRGTRHGSAAICLTSHDDVVLVSSDGETWGLPGGRPEGDENWRATLEREVLEEACARVDEATLLGFSTGAVVRGPEEGLVLVRALWRAGVSLGEWEPRYETSHRLLVPPSKALAYMNPPQDRSPILQRWFHEALAT